MIDQRSILTETVIFPVDEKKKYNITEDILQNLYTSFLTISLLDLWSKPVGRDSTIRDHF